MAERRAGRELVQRAVVLAPGVFAPRHLAGVGAEVLAADVVVLAPLGPAQPREVAFRLVGAGPVIAERDGVVDAGQPPSGGPGGILVEHG